MVIDKNNEISIVKLHIYVNTPIRQIDIKLQFEVILKPTN